VIAIDLPDMAIPHGRPDQDYGPIRNAAAVEVVISAA
jgi:hypothetical protein